MAQMLESTSRRALESGLLRAVIVAAVVAAAFVIAVVAFGWTLPAGPSFDLTPVPGADLPF
jgi:hypothetical protein